MLNHFKNVRQYLHLLPLHEQMAEINKMIDYYSNIKFLYSNQNKRFNKIKQLKEFKRLIIINHIARSIDDIHPCNYISVFF